MRRGSGDNFCQLDQGRWQDQGLVGVGARSENSVHNNTFSFTPPNCNSPHVASSPHRLMPLVGLNDSGCPVGETIAQLWRRTWGRDSWFAYYT